MTKVSIIIPSYKSEIYLSEAIESALSQEDENINIECIVVIDGSPENDFKIAEKFLPKIILIDQENQGVSIARNNGFKKSTGEFICFLDADDILESGAIANRLKVIRQNEKYVMVHGPATVVNTANETLDYKWEWPVGDDASGDLLDKLFQMGFIMFSSALIKRDSFVNSGGFDEGYKLHASEDLILWLRLALCGPFGYVPEKTLRYRVVPNSASRNSRKMELGEFYARLRFVLTRPDAYEKLGCKKIRNKLISQALISGARLEKNNHFDDAMLMYFDVAKKYPFAIKLYKPIVRVLLEKFKKNH